MHFYALSLPHQKKKSTSKTIPSDSTQSHGKRLMIHKLVAEGNRPARVRTKEFPSLMSHCQKKKKGSNFCFNIKRRVYYIITQGNILPSMLFVPFPFFFFFPQMNEIC